MPNLKNLYKTPLLILIISMFFISGASFYLQADKGVGANNIDAVLLIDFSKSMNKSDPEALSIEAFKLFIDLCSTYGDRIGVAAYTDEIVKEIPLKEIKSEYDKETLKASLENIPKGNYTDIGLGLKKAVELLESPSPSSNRPMIILLSDGRNDVKGSNRTEEQSKEDMTEAIDKAIEKEYKIYTIGLNANNDVDVDELNKIAQYTNGHAFITDSAEELPKILNTIFTDYVVAYNNAPEIIGKIQNIKIFSNKDKSIDLSSIFRDPDSDAMLFKIESSNDDIADFDISKGELHIKPIKKGISQLLLTAEDPRGATASISINLKIITAWYKTVILLTVILIPILVYLIYFISHSRKPLHGEIAIEIKDENTGHIKAPYYVKLKGYKGKVTLHQLLQRAKDYRETDRILLSPGRQERLNIKNLSPCLIHKDGRILIGKKVHEIRANEKVVISLNKINKSIIIEYIA